MANTLKFGNGEWYGKKDTILAYNDENNNYKPLPFDFSRDGSATRVNKDGLIETVGSGEPRVDYKDDSKGAMLLEPSRTNYMYPSINLADWASFVASGTVTRTNQYASSPDGTNSATRIQMSGGNSIQWTYQNTSNSATFVSFYAKATSENEQYFRLFWNNGNNGSDLIATNEWKRFEVEVSQGSTLPIGITTHSNLSASDILIWGFQAEQGSYATSYIPTQGSVVTRLQDDFTCNLPDTDSFNSSSGFSVITKFGIGEANGSTSVPFFQFNDDTSNTYIGFGSNQFNFRCRLNLNGTSYLNTQDAPRTQENNLFVSCDSNGWSQGANGSVGDTGTNDASVFDKLSNININVIEVYGIIKIKEILIYNTRLSNSELQALTTI